MVQTMKWNFSIVRKFVDKLKKKGSFKVVFFGSRVRGNFYEDSDFDLVVVSDGFSGMNLGDRSVFVGVEWEWDYPVDILCYTQEEFERNRDGIGIVGEAVREGVEI